MAQRTFRQLAFLFQGILSIHCGSSGGSGNEVSQDANAQKTDSSPDTALVTDGPSEDVATLAPNIKEALQCTPRPTYGPGNSTDHQRMEVDIKVFPDAICNDGSVASIYFRPFKGEQNRNKWVINLRGGGGCLTGASCAARWCGCTSVGSGKKCPYASEPTNFDIGNMIGDGPGSLKAEGIWLRGDTTRPNPIGDYNQVRFTYCSSDYWAGTKRSVQVTTDHPVTGALVTYSLHFLGARILDANLATLRGDGVSRPIYTLSGTPVTLPSLDDADEVVLAGDSAGGAGVIKNLDRVAQMLREKNNICKQGTNCPLVIHGLMDAIVGPERKRLDYSQYNLAKDGINTYEAFIQALNTAYETTHGALKDESCLTWHKANKPGTEYECADESHVIRNHLSTPFFVRMALLDNLVSGNYIDSGLKDPVLGPLTPAIFAQILQRELLQFPNMKNTAEEGASMAKAPSVFGPACTKHDTIHDSTETFGVTVTPQGGAVTRLFDVFDPWRTSGTVKAVVTAKADRSDTQCPQ